MTNKVQMTLTMDESVRKYIEGVAKRQFFGNSSMAITQIVADHAKMVNDKSMES